MKEESKYNHEGLSWHPTLDHHMGNQEIYCRGQGRGLRDAQVLEIQRIHFAHFEFNFHLGLELSESKSRVAALHGSSNIRCPMYLIHQALKSLS